LPELTPAEWLLAIAGALGLGVGKAGLAGMSLFHVLIFAFLFGARDSTGIVLPMLLMGDVGAVTLFHQHARWDYVRRMLPPACFGVVGGALLMRGLSDAQFRPTIGWIILALTILQVSRMYRPEWFGTVPHARWFAWLMGLLAGATTMLANAAGPVFAIYLLALTLPKFQFVGTNAWFFLIINAFKVPFSIALGLIHGQTLLLNLTLLPAVIAGLLGGRWIVGHVPQRIFDGLLLMFAAVAALRLIGAL
jgi:uncharacterized membrane protein YfcA